ncbi:MAG: oligoribonuclease [Halothiobacillaceae bacterium]|nr:oligoribonuclease [Halothiobacillaceae bacterium]
MQNRLIWIDLEMTGLEPEQDVIIEIATLITDEQLNILAEGPVIAVHQPENVLQGMDEWNQSHHSASGLLERVHASQHNSLEAEQLTLDFLRQWSEKRSSPMCGNSICQDRRFLARHMPKLEDFFHYRNLDVSTLKELARRWYPAVPKFEKAGAHRALDDIRASLDELRYYRETILR